MVTSFEELFKAKVDFRERYLHDPESMTVHPRVAEQLLLDIPQGMVTFPVKSKSGTYLSTIHGIALMEDVKLPIGLVQYAAGKNVGRLWLEAYYER